MPKLTFWTLQLPFFVPSECLFVVVTAAIGFWGTHKCGGQRRAGERHRTWPRKYIPRECAPWRATFSP